MRLNRSGFSFIEIMIAMAIIAVLFIPVMQLYSFTLGAVSDSRDRITAINLGRWYLEKLKNSKMTTKDLALEGDLVFPPLQEPPLMMNKIAWRINRQIDSAARPVQIKIGVFRDSDPDRPVFEIVTLVHDFIWLKT